LESIRLQRELQGEQAASDFLAQAAGQNPRGLMQMLTDSPELLTSGAAPAIQDYVATRMAQQQEQQAKRNQFSSKVLAPSLMKSLPPAQQLQLSRKIDAGMSITDAFDELEAEEMQQTASAKMRQLALDAAKAGANPQDISAAMQSPDPELFLASLSSKKTTKTGQRYTQDDLNKAREYVLALEEEGVPKTDPRYVRGLARFDAIDLALDEDIFGPAVVKEQPAPGSAEAIEAARLAKEKADLEKKQQAPTLPPAPPATAEEEAALKEQQKRGVTQEQRQQLADAAWTGVKGVTAARGADATGTPDVISEARKAIVGGETTNKRAQRIAALARAYADGRNVKVGTAVAGGLASGFSEEIDTFATPAEALVRELGYEPDAIVGQAPSSPGGPLRDVTALEAANAILADTAVPFLELKKGVKAASQMTPETQSAYERAKAKAAGLPTPNP
jgi:hypothetical protein